MAFSREIVDEAMARCGRHCCICRRFAPLHLQVHHIEERAEGGDDSADNAIPICLTCHSDVHTETKLTRRFSVEELKRHREVTFALVASGKLSAPDHPRPAQSILAEGGAVLLEIEGLPQISKEAVQMLVMAAEGDGLITAVGDMEGYTFAANHTVLSQNGRGRETAKWQHAVRQLCEQGFIESPRGNEIYRVTHEGYLAADAYLAATKQLP